jgi:hypothetical protein
LPALGGFLFAAGWLGGGCYYYYLYPAVRLDRNNRCVERTRFPILIPAQRIPFESLRAIQILRETWIERSNLGSARVGSYELNLVLKDGRRANVADHADLDYLRENARRLRAFLGIPIWDRAGRDAPPAPVTARQRLLRATWQVPVGVLALVASASLLLLWPPGLGWLELVDLLLGVVSSAIGGLMLTTSGVREWRRGRPPRL